MVWRACESGKRYTSSTKIIAYYGKQGHQFGSGWPLTKNCMRRSAIGPSDYLFSRNKGLPQEPSTFEACSVNVRTNHVNVSDPLMSVDQPNLIMQYDNQRTENLCQRRDSHTVWLPIRGAGFLPPDFAFKANPELRILTKASLT